MRRLGRWLLALVVALAWPKGRREREERIVPPGSPDRGAETVAAAFLFAAALAAVAFVVV
jgi:hypothetical protein